MFLLFSCRSNRFIIYPIPCLEDTRYSNISSLNINLFTANDPVYIINIKPGYIIEIISLYIIYSLYCKILLTTNIKENALADCCSIGIWDYISL